MKTEIEIKTNALMATLRASMSKVVAMDGRHATVEYKESEFVINGGAFSICTGNGTYQIWVGINWPRLFFIAYVCCDATKAKEELQFCFGGAKKVGWEFNYENFRSDANVVSVWGTCMTAMEHPLAIMSDTSRSQGSATADVTEYGHFWMTDIAMMAQSFVRTCERSNLKTPVETPPAPLAWPMRRR